MLIGLLQRNTDNLPNWKLLPPWQRRAHSLPLRRLHYYRPITASHLQPLHQHICHCVPLPFTLNFCNSVNEPQPKWKPQPQRQLKRDSQRPHQ